MVIIEEIVEPVTVTIEEIGIKGDNGKSSYELAVLGGFVGTQAEWILSLQGSNAPTIHSGLDLDDGTNPHSTTKADVGLSNVDNTSDADKPVSTAQQAESDTKLDNTTEIQAFSSLTQADYDLIETPSETTIYFIE